MIGDSDSDISKLWSNKQISSTGNEEDVVPKGESNEYFYALSILLSKASACWETNRSLSETHKTQNSHHVTLASANIVTR